MKEKNNTLFLASEVYKSGIGNLIGKIREHSLENIYIHEGDIRDLIFELTKIEESLNVIINDSSKYVKYGKIGYLLRHNFEIFFNKEYNDVIMYLIYLNNYNDDLDMLSYHIKKKNF